MMDLTDHRTIHILRKIGICHILTTKLQFLSNKAGIFDNNNNIKAEIKAFFRT
jgi:hypothetical protein